MDTGPGMLEVGVNFMCEVVVNFDHDIPTGHIVFSPHQARDFANLLLKKAAEADDLARQLN